MKNIIFVIFLLIGFGHCGKVLFYMPFISESVKITFTPVARELAARGHSVTIVTPFPDKNVDMRQISFDNAFMVENIRRVSKEKLSSTSNGSFPIFELFSISFTANDLALGNPEVRAMANPRPEDRFDIVIVSVLFGNEAGYYLAHKNDAPLVLYCTGMVSYSWLDFAVGQPHHPGYLPMAFSNFLPSMTFLERVANVFMTAALHAARDFFVLSKVNQLLDKHFPEDRQRPDLIELERNTSLAIGFGHPLLMDGWRPMAPNFVHVGMMNCKPANMFQTGDRVGDFLAGATNGAIFISFGSILQSSQMSDDRRKLFLKVFSRLKQRVIWKWETEVMEDLPPNVILSKWLPQNDVLGNDNLKVFITHGGQSSFQESLCYQKPVVVVSVMADQFANGQEAERLGFGLHIPFLELTEEKLLEALNRIIQEPGFSQTAKTLGVALVDQIVPPLDKAVWWLEHVMRHPKMYRGRSLVHRLSWYQYLMLDVLFFYFGVFTFFAYIAVSAFKFCCRKSKKVEVKKSKTD